MGWSPGYCAAALGVSRTAIDKAIKSDKLYADRVFTIDANGKKHLQAIYIDRDSFAEYESAKINQRVPKGFRASQQRLFA